MLCLYLDQIFVPILFLDMRVLGYLYLITHLQVRLCQEKKSGNIYAMKKLKKSEMLSRGQVRSDHGKQSTCTLLLTSEQLHFIHF